MSPHLVIVHGIGGPRDPEATLSEWQRCLAVGMAEAGQHAAASALSDGSIRTSFAYYADLFDRPGAQGEADDISDDDAVFLHEMLIETLQWQIADETDDDRRLTLSRALRQLDPAGGQGAGNVLRRVIAATAALLGSGGPGTVGGWASGKLMRAALAQVPRYLDRAGEGTPTDVGRRIRDRVLTAIGDGPVIVVAHSLGSVVTYEVLHDFPGRVRLWVTLGSPLGLRGIVRPRLRPQPLVTPDCVERWLNYWDRDDVIVAEPDLASIVDANRGQIRPESTRIRSTGLWRHSMTKYLRQPEVGRQIAAELNAMETLV